MLRFKIRLKTCTFFLINNFLINFTTINELECYLFNETFCPCCQCDPWLLTGAVGVSQQEAHLWYMLYPPGFCHPPTSQTLVLIASCIISQPLLKIRDGQIIIIWILFFLKIFLCLKYFLVAFSIIYDIFQVKMILWN